MLPGRFSCYLGATFDALLAGGGLLVLAGVIMVARRVISPQLLIAVVVVALVGSAGSAAVARSRDSGMGRMTSRGYPKPYHFDWKAFETPERHRGVNVMYFAANTFVYLGAAAFIASLLPRGKGERRPFRIPGKMAVLRVTLGIVFFILGIIGGFVPIMQGWIFMLLAFLMLFPRTRAAEKILAKAGPKLPRTVRFLRRVGVGEEQTSQGDTMRAE